MVEEIKKKNNTLSTVMEAEERMINIISNTIIKKEDQVILIWLVGEIDKDHIEIMIHKHLVESHKLKEYQCQEDHYQMEFVIWIQECIQDLIDLEKLGESTREMSITMNSNLAEEFRFLQENITITIMITNTP